MILSENNLRILFDDTSIAASFPPNDWRLIANDSSNGGSSHFTIEDATSGNDVIRAFAGARNNALVVDAQGDVGLGTSTPALDIDIKTGDTPSIRLQQDGTSGFTPQSWDIAGNETNFFIRDATGGSQLPFRIRPGADTDSLFIDVDDDVGIGTASPDSSLDIQRSDGTAKLTIQEINSTASPRQLIHAKNNGDTIVRLENTDAEIIWDISATEDATLVIDNPDNTGKEFELQEDGSLVVLGTVTGLSDRHAKQNIEEPDPSEILSKLEHLPIFEWSYKNDKKSTRHIGPMAQDFKHVFGLGSSDKLIAFSDTSGIALAAIQGLAKELKEKEAQIEILEKKAAQVSQLQRKSKELELRLEELTKRINSID